MSEELPEVTADQLRALRELRFVTVNQSRDRVWGYDKDKARVEAVGFGCYQFQRAPGVWDCQMTTATSCAAPPRGRARVRAAKRVVENRVGAWLAGRVRSRPGR